MTRRSAGPTFIEQRQLRRVVFLLLPGVQLLDLAGPAQVFDTAARLFGAPYTLLFCATSDEIRSAQQLHLAHLEPLPEIDKNNLILVPGTGASPSSNHPLLDEPARRWLQENYQAGAHIAAICSGTAALGEAGLLHRRRCTTHWELVAELQSCYPTAQVLEGVLDPEVPVLSVCDLGIVRDVQPHRAALRGALLDVHDRHPVARDGRRRGAHRPLPDALSVSRVALAAPDP